MSPSAFSPKPGVMMLGDVVHAHDEFAALSNIADVLVRRQPHGAPPDTTD